MNLYLRSLARTKSANTIKGARSRLKRFKEHLEATKVPLLPASLSRRLLEDFDGALAEDGLMASSRRDTVRTVERWWAWCWDDEDIGQHFGRPRRIEMPAPESSPARAPTWAEMDLCIRHAGSEWLRRHLTLLRFLGLRETQALQLEWRDVDLEAGLVTIRGELGKSRQEKQGRVLPITPHLVAELAGWGRREGPLLGRDAPDTSYRHRVTVEAWEATGGPDDVWRGQPHHAFRKGFRSELIRAGGHTDAIEYYCGRSVGTRGDYTDPRALPLVELAELVPPIGHAPNVPTLKAAKGR